MIVIVDYGLGNLGSIRNILRKIGYESEISSDIRIIEQASKIILPGVGSFDTGMSKLNDLELVPMLNKKACHDKTPILGICLGAQLMCKSSEEGEQPGLGWFDAEVLAFKGRFGNDRELSVPNMGWLEVSVNKHNPLTKNLPPAPRFYFVHSYFLAPNQKEDILMSSEYGINYTSAIHRENIYGVQFHPEKSHKYGFHLLKNFAEI